jgi:hypothetical protein
VFICKDIFTLFQDMPCRRNAVNLTEKISCQNEIRIIEGSTAL